MTFHGYGKSSTSSTSEDEHLAYRIDTEILETTLVPFLFTKMAKKRGYEVTGPTTLRNRLRAGSLQLTRPATALLQVDVLRLLGFPLLRPIHRRRRLAQRRQSRIGVGSRYV
jgi:hypothetical protein